MSWVPLDWSSDPSSLLALPWLQLWSLPQSLSPGLPATNLTLSNQPFIPPLEWSFLNPNLSWSLTPFLQVFQWLPINYKKKLLYRTDQGPQLNPSFLCTAYCYYSTLCSQIFAASRICFASKLQCLLFPSLAMPSLSFEKLLFISQCSALVTISVQSPSFLTALLHIIPYPFSVPFLWCSPGLFYNSLCTTWCHIVSLILYLLACEILGISNPMSTISLIIVLSSVTGIHLVSM